jgi:hypothetical protein
MLRTPMNLETGTQGGRPLHFAMTVEAQRALRLILWQQGIKAWTAHVCERQEFCQTTGPRKLTEDPHTQPSPWGVGGPHCVEEPH